MWVDSAKTQYTIRLSDANLSVSVTAELSNYDLEFQEIISELQCHLPY
jgi:hypothetical protein